MSESHVKSINDPGFSNFTFYYFYVLAVSFMLLLLPLLGLGQGYIEGMNISYENSQLRVENNEIKEKFMGHIFRASSGVPIFLVSNKSQYLILGGTIEGINFSGKHPSFKVNSVFGLQPIIGFSRHFDKKYVIRFIFMPFLNSDFHHIKSNYIKLGGLVNGGYTIKPGLTFRASLGYRDQWYGPQLIVMLGLDWKINDRWRVFGDAPKDFTINYIINPKTAAGFNLEALNTTYRLKNDQYLNHVVAQPGLYFERYIFPSLALRGTVSYNFIRNEEIYNTKDKRDFTLVLVPIGYNPTPLNPGFLNRANFKLSLSYRVFR